jgi:hypothetical protein
MLIFCQSCGQQLTITEEHLGQPFDCPICGVEQMAPNPNASVVPPCESKITKPASQEQQPPIKPKVESGKRMSWSIGLSVFGIFVVNVLAKSAGISIGPIPIMLIALLLGAFGWAIDDEIAKKKR